MRQVMKRKYVFILHNITGTHVAVKSGGSVRDKTYLAIFRRVNIDTVCVRWKKVLKVFKKFIILKILDHKFIGLLFVM